MGAAAAPAGPLHNDIVGYFLAAVTVFYGITLGLLAVATRTTYSGTQDKVDHEAQVLASLYRDTDTFPEPLRTKLEEDLRAYTRQVIDVSSPLQRQGIVLNSTKGMLLHFWRTILLTTLLGLMVFLIGTLDRPYRGKVSIGPVSLERVYRQVMVR